MKYINKFIVALCTVVLTLSSCIDDEKIEVSSECGIISFSVSDIRSNVTIKKADGGDTTIIKTIPSSEIRFNIDQINGKITCVDSLPNWVDLTKVVPKFVAYGNVYGRINPDKTDTNEYYMTSGADSVDLSSPFTMRVISTDGVSKKVYTVQMFKRTTNCDTLEWKANNINTNFNTYTRPLVLNGKVYLFHENDNGETCVSTSTNGIEWDTKNANAIKYESVTLFKDNMYALGTDGYMFSSTDGETWTKVSSSPFVQILAADKQNIYVYDGTSIVGSSDLQTWSNYGDKDMEYIPTSFISSFSSASKTNPNIEILTMVGLNENNLNNSIAWYKVSSANKYVDQNWIHINANKSNIFPFVYLSGLSATAYKNAIYAIGKTDGSYEYFYRSDDNGISWHPIKSQYTLPDDINSNNAFATILTVGDEMWIIKGDKIWKGAIL